jgi:hypothetical protein
MAKRKRKRFTVRRVPGSYGQWRIEGPYGAWNRNPKSEAVAWARKKARENEPSQLVVFRVDGTIEFENTYPRSSDPRPKRHEARYRG